MNKSSIKVSEKSKDFLKRIRINRIKLDLKELDYNQSIEQVCDFFKSNSEAYTKMLKYGGNN